jgi:hypothetical protein
MNETKTTDADLRHAITSQYLAALGMLRQVIEKCPDDFWLSTPSQNQFWRVAYHTLFFTHLYLQQTAQEFVPWHKHRHEVESFSQEQPEQADAAPYSRQDVLEYLGFCEEEVKNKTASVNLQADSGFPWYRISKIEMQFANIRHIQQHTGELAEQLSDKTGIQINWMRAGL